MADNHQEVVDVGGDDIFVYMGGEQEVPRDVRRAKIDESVDTIAEGVFAHCTQLTDLEGHDKLKKIEGHAFICCRRLRRMNKMNGVIEIEANAFDSCHALSELEFEKLGIIGFAAFLRCNSLRSIYFPSIRRVGEHAFQDCVALTEAKFGEDLEEVGEYAFHDSALRSIAIPLKDNLTFINHAFVGCDNLSRVDIVGGIHETISSLHLDSWKDDVREEIKSINQTLPDTLTVEMTPIIRQWIRSVLRDTEHYKVEHKVLVKEAMTLLELALWKAKLLDEEGRKCEAEKKMSQRAKIDKESTRNEHRVTCGANIVIKNVLPFLALK